MVSECHRSNPKALPTMESFLAMLSGGSAQKKYIRELDLSKVLPVLLSDCKCSNVLQLLYCIEHYFENLSEQSNFSIEEIVSYLKIYTISYPCIFARMMNSTDEVCNLEVLEQIRKCLRYFEESWNHDPCDVFRINLLRIFYVTIVTFTPEMGSISNKNKIFPKLISIRKDHNIIDCQQLVQEAKRLFLLIVEYGKLSNVTSVSLLVTIRCIVDLIRCRPYMYKDLVNLMESICLNVPKYFEKTQIQNLNQIILMELKVIERLSISFIFNEQLINIFRSLDESPNRNCKMLPLTQAELMELGKLSIDWKCTKIAEKNMMTSSRKRKRVINQMEPSKMKKIETKKNMEVSKRLIVYEKDLIEKKLREVNKTRYFHKYREQMIFDGIQRLINNCVRCTGMYVREIHSENDLKKKQNQLNDISTTFGRLGQTVNYSSNSIHYLSINSLLNNEIAMKKLKKIIFDLLYGRVIDDEIIDLFLYWLYKEYCLCSGYLSKGRPPSTHGRYKSVAKLLFSLVSELETHHIAEQSKHHSYFNTMKNRFVLCDYLENNSISQSSSSSSSMMTFDCSFEKLILLSPNIPNETFSFIKEFCLICHRTIMARQKKTNNDMSMTQMQRITNQGLIIVYKLLVQRLDDDHDEKLLSILKDFIFYTEDDDGDRENLLSSQTLSLLIQLYRQIPIIRSIIERMARECVENLILNEMDEVRKLSVQDLYLKFRLMVRLIPYSVHMLYETRELYVELNEIEEVKEIIHISIESSLQRFLFANDDIIDQFHQFIIDSTNEKDMNENELESSKEFLKIVLDVLQFHKILQFNTNDDKRFDIRNPNLLFPSKIAQTLYELFQQKTFPITHKNHIQFLNSFVGSLPTETCEELVQNLKEIFSDILLEGDEETYCQITVTDLRQFIYCLVTHPIISGNGALERKDSITSNISVTSQTNSNGFGMEIKNLVLDLMLLSYDKTENADDDKSEVKLNTITKTAVQFCIKDPRMRDKNIRGGPMNEEMLLNILTLLSANMRKKFQENICSTIHVVPKHFLYVIHRFLNLYQGKRICIHNILQEIIQDLIPLWHFECSMKYFLSSLQLLLPMSARIIMRLPFDVLKMVIQNGNEYRTCLLPQLRNFLGHLSLNQRKNISRENQDYIENFPG
ncbi:hypothetical protein SNEBB_003536 [Seison nebaliae]|nr:hypothetical protein SNEBB_003536 [Seison nebaliae]